jgi:hypothetical protein
MMEWHTPIVGRAWLVTGYHTGDFIGRCESLHRERAFFTILDTLRPAPRIHERCPFPGCVGKDFHGGDHELTSMRVGATIELLWRHARYVPVEDLPAGLVGTPTMNGWTAPFCTRG